jgi:hypothetical protein
MPVRDERGDDPSGYLTNRRVVQAVSAAIHSAVLTRCACINPLWELASEVD